MECFMNVCLLGWPYTKTLTCLNEHMLLNTCCFNIFYLITLTFCSTATLARPFVPLRSFSLVPSHHTTTKKTHPQHWNQCEEVSDPCLIHVHFKPPVFYSSIIPPFSHPPPFSPPLHQAFPHFLTPSCLLWPLNVSRWEDTTPIVIQPALSDHCVALANTPQLRLSVNDQGG